MQATLLGGKVDASNEVVSSREKETVVSHQDIYERVLGSLHEAMLDEAHWPAVAGFIDEACCVKGNALVVSEGNNQEDIDIFFASFCYRGQRDRQQERRYFERYYPDDERVPRVRRLPDGKLVHVTDLYTPQELKTSPTYNKGLPRIGYQNGLNVRMDGPHGTHIIWGLADPTGRGGWGSDQIQMIRRLFPHVRQFVRVRQAVSSAEARDASLTGLLDNTKVGVIYLNRRGRIVTANDRARDVLREDDGLFDRGGFMNAWLPADHACLERLLERALPKSSGEAVSASMTVRRSGLRPRLALHISPVRVGQMDFSAWRVAALVLLVESGGQVRIDQGCQPDIDPGLVAGTLGLTPTEGRVAALLAGGYTVRDIALATGRKETSIRWHLRHIYKKHGIARQADLVRLVLSTADLSGIRR